MLDVRIDRPSGQNPGGPSLTSMNIRASVSGSDRRLSTGRRRLGTTDVSRPRSSRNVVTSTFSANDDISLIHDRISSEHHSNALERF